MNYLCNCRKGKFTLHVEATPKWRFFVENLPTKPVSSMAFFDLLEPYMDKNFFHNLDVPIEFAIDDRRNCIDVIFEK